MEKSYQKWRSWVHPSTLRVIVLPSPHKVAIGVASAATFLLSCWLPLVTSSAVSYCSSSRYPGLQTSPQHIQYSFQKSKSECAMVQSKPALILRRITSRGDNFKFPSLSPFVAAVVSHHLSNWKLSTKPSVDVSIVETPDYRNNGDPIQESFTNAQGLKLRTYIWLPGNGVPTAKFAATLEDSWIKPLLTSASQMRERFITRFPDISSLLSIGKATGATETDNANIKGVVVLVHGFLEHCRGQYFSKPPPLGYTLRDPLHKGYPFNEKMEAIANPCEISYEGSWIHKLNQEGFIVAGFDLQGHGLSERWNNLPCHVENMDHFAKDTLHFIKLMRRKLRMFVKNESTPIFIMGTSLGGWVCARAVQMYEDEMKHGSSFSGFKWSEGSSLTDTTSIDDSNTPQKAEELSVSGPMLSLKGMILLSPMLDLNRRKRKLRWHRLKYILMPLSVIFPQLWLESTKRGAQYAHPYMQHYWKSDPLIHKKGFALDMFLRLMHSSDAIHKRAHMQKIHPKSCESVLIVHNILDPLCDYAGSLKFFDGITKIDDKMFLALNPHEASKSKILKHKSLRDKKSTVAEIQSPTEIWKHKNSIALLPGVDVWHNLANEPANGILFDYILEWMNGKLQK